MSELIDREAFIEQERKVYCENCDRRQGMKNGKLTFCYEIGDAPCRACWGEDILTDLEDFPAAPRWHRVEEELPPDGVTVWCAIYTTDLIRSMPGESVSEAMMRCQKEAAKHPRCDMGTYYKGEGWSECLFGAPMVCTPKYWCYLPEPPKEVEE